MTGILISYSIFNVVYGKITSKKRKTWSCDGLLEVTGRNAVLTVISFYFSLSALLPNPFNIPDI